MLSETLVVAIGEMGRTPTFNTSGGRDHWGNVWSFVMAGAGIRTAQVIGASDRKGAEVHETPIQPADLTATMAHLLGIGHNATFLDKFNRPYKVTEGEPIHAVLGWAGRLIGRLASVSCGRIHSYRHPQQMS